MASKDLQDQVFKCLPAEFREEVKHEYHYTCYNSVRNILSYLFGHHNLTSDEEYPEMLMVSRKDIIAHYNSAQKDIEENCNDNSNANLYHRAAGRRQMLIRLFGKAKCLPDELASEPASEKAEPSFKVGDKVINHLTGKMDVVKCKAGNRHYRLCGCGYDVHEDCLEPYTEPTQTNDNMEEKDLLNHRQSSSNCDKAEDKELNLCEILKGHEGIELYSQIWGKVKLNRLDPDNNNGSQPLVSIRIKDRQCRNITADGFLCYGERFGKVVLWPSEEAFFKHHDEPYKAWQEWAEASKPKRWRAENRHLYWYICDDGSIGSVPECLDENDNNTYGFGNYFRTKELAQQAAEAVRECLMKFHENHNQQ